MQTPLEKTEKRPLEEKKDKVHKKPKPNNEWSFKSGAIHLLQKAQKPLTAREMVEKMIKELNFQTSGKTPERTLASLIYTDLKNNGKSSLFSVHGKGLFGLRFLIFDNNIESLDFLH